MTEELKKKIIENLQWLGDQTGNTVKIIDRLSTNKGNYDRHFTRTSQFTFIMEHFGVRTSGGIGIIYGENVHFEFQADIIKRIERSENELEFESDLDNKTSRLIKFKIEKPGDNKVHNG